LTAHTGRHIYRDAETQRNKRKEEDKHGGHEAYEDHGGFDEVGLKPRAFVDLSFFFSSFFLYSSSASPRPRAGS
jgi:hypothetical protein